MMDQEQDNKEEELLEGEVPENEATDDTVYPAEVRVSRAQFSCSHVKVMVEKRHELELSPDFQRYSVWNFHQKSELVESILMGIPIPVIYLFEDREGNKQIVDGKQRITTIIDFQNDLFKLKGLHIMGKCNGKDFSSLSPKLQGAFEDYQLSFYIIQPPTPERVKYDILDRVNRGGTQLNHQEMREALYMGKATDLLKLLKSKNNLFVNATGHGVTSMRKKDTYLILRSIAFMLMWGFADVVKQENGKEISYKSDIDDFLANTMVFLNEKASDNLIDTISSRFLLSMDYIFHILGPDGFRFDHAVGDNRRPISMPLFETLTYIFSHSVVNKKNPQKTRNIINKMKKDWDTSGSFKGSNVDSITKVVERKELIDVALKELGNV